MALRPPETRLAEPALPTAGPEVLLLVGDLDRRRPERAGGLRAGEEVDVDTAHAPGAELDVAGSTSLVSRRPLASLQLREDRGGDHPRSALGEHAGLGHADRRDV